MTEREQTLEEAIFSWKKEYGEVYTTTINDIQFFFRLLPLEEYNTLKNMTETNEDLEDMIVQRTLLEPVIEEWDNIFAGFTTTLAAAVLESSMIRERADKANNIKDTIENNIEEISSALIRQIPLTIAHAFPAYTPTDIKKMTLKDQIDLYSEAIWVLTELKGLQIDIEAIK